MIKAALFIFIAVAVTFAGFPFIILGILKLFCLSSEPLGFSQYLCGPALTDLGQFGDSFGGLTALAAAGSFLFLWRTYHLQRQELTNMQQQAGRQTAWNMISMLCGQYRNLMVQSVAQLQEERNVDLENAKGLQGLGALIAQAQNRVEKTEGGSVASANIIMLVGTQLSPYAGCFRLLHRMLKFIHELKEPDSVKTNYARIVRAMLSDIELEAILINCLAEPGKGMKKYVEEYEILNNYTPDLPVNLSPETAHALCKCYNPDAFGKKAS